MRFICCAQQTNVYICGSVIKLSERECLIYWRRSWAGTLLWMRIYLSDSFCFFGWWSVFFNNFRLHFRSGLKEMSAEFFVKSAESVTSNAVNGLWSCSLLPRIRWRFFSLIWVVITGRGQLLTFYCNWVTSIALLVWSRKIRVWVHITECILQVGISRLSNASQEE